MTAARAINRSSASLTPEAVIAIREAFAAGGVSQAELAVLYRVEQPTISQIVRGETWRAVGGPRTHKGRPARVTHAPGKVWGRTVCGQHGRALFIAAQGQPVSCATCQRLLREKP